jgi:UDPglucose 6-dehydrogenase
VRLTSDPLTAARDADAVVVSTAWPDYREIGADDLIAALGRPIVLDPNRGLAPEIAADPRIRYVTVGKP